METKFIIPPTLPEFLTNEFDYQDYIYDHFLANGIITFQNKLNHNEQV